MDKDKKEEIIKILKDVYGYDLYYEDEKGRGLDFESAELKTGDIYFISITNDNIEFGLNNAYFWFKRKDLEKILEFMKSVKKFSKKDLDNAKFGMEETL